MRGPTFRGVSSLLNWLHGRGGMLIPWHAPNVEITDGSSVTLHYSFVPRVQALQRLWAFRFRGEVPFVAGTTLSVTRVNIDIDGDGAVEYPTSHNEHTVLVMQDVSARVAQSTTATVEIDVPAHSGTRTIELIGLACVEVPRYALTLGAGEFGTDSDIIAPSQPIFDGVDGTGVYDVATSVVGALQNARRNGMFCWSVPDADAITTTSTSAVDAFLLGIPVLGRQFFRSDTTRKLVVRARCRAAASDGEVSVECSNSGGSAASAVTSSGSFAWTEPFIVEADSEDLSEPGGLRAAAFDYLMPRIKAGAAGTFYLSSIQVCEAPLCEGRSGWSSSNQYYSASTSFLNGSSTMTRVALIRVDTVPSADSYILAKGTGASDSWAMYINSSGAPVFRVDGVSSVGSALVAGKTYLLVGTYDGTNVRLSVNGAITDTDALGAYATSTDELAIGASNDAGSNPATGITIVGTAASDTAAMPSGRFDDYYREVTSLADVAHFEGVSFLTSARMAGVHRDVVGGVTLSTRGALTSVDSFAPQYG